MNLVLSLSHLIDCEYSLSREIHETEHDDTSANDVNPSSGNDDEVVVLDKSIEDKEEIEAIDKFYESGCCSLGPKNTACWTQFKRKSVIAPDRFFGLFKRQFRRSTIDTMYDIVRAVKESTIAGKNIPVPTVDPGPLGTRNCQWYDWTPFLGNFFAQFQVYLYTITSKYRRSMKVK